MTKPALPRMSMAFMSPTNAPYERLASWQSAKGLDGDSSTETAPMPPTLKAQLAARRLLTSDQLPSTLAAPGSF